MPEKLLTTEEVALYLGISKEEVESLVRKGKLPAYRIGGAFLRFRQESVETLKRKIHSPIAYPKIGFLEKITDILYFNDFYIISFLIIIALIAVIVYF